MKHILLTAALALFTLTAKADPPDLAAKLQNISVTLIIENDQCSGTVFNRDGQSFVLSAGHCVEDQRKVMQVAQNGQPRSVVKYPVVTIVKEIYQDGEAVGTTTVKSDVIAFSSSDYGDDVIVLKARAPITGDSAEFSPEKILPVGSELAHVGSLGGMSGSNSFTVGILSQVGRMYDDRVYDQSTCTAVPGSSGGGVFLRSNGQYVGMLTRGKGETDNLYVPMRRLRTFAKDHNIPFLFDPKAKVDLDAVRREYNEPLPETKTSLLTPES